MKRVVLESLYRADTETEIARNVDYGRACLRDSLAQGESPIASHLLYPQVLNDEIPHERALGISANLAWVPAAEKMVVYVDFGVSPGMQLAIDTATRADLPIEYRKLEPEASHTAQKAGNETSRMWQEPPEAQTGASEGNDTSGRDRAPAGSGQASDGGRAP